MFVCGPTVYDSPHIGHARIYIMFDVLAKWLRHLDYRVNYIQNITDIDDKIIKKAKEDNKTVAKIAQKFEKEYLEAMEKLGVDSVSKYIRASDNIKNIIKQIEILIDRGYAYKSEDGIYFNISKFKDYGKLSGRTVQQAEDAVSRIDESTHKKNKGDFVLWRLSKSDEPAWKSPWGMGRPGWHIEDTAITEKQLGRQYDIHCGGLDLMFPHHEAEIAQQESASGKKPFVRYWLHSGLLIVNGQKMSKSLGNFITISEILKKYPASALRLFFLTTHYRSPIDYKEDYLKQSEAATERLREFITKLESLKGGKRDRAINIDQIIDETKTKFEGAMNDDLGTPQAVAVIFDLVKKINPFLDDLKLDKTACKKIVKFLHKIDKILAIIPKHKRNIPNKIMKLAEIREKLRRDNRYSEADDVRGQIRAKGYSIDDTSNGPLVKKI